MPLTHMLRIVALPLGMAMTTGASAQDMLDVQRSVDRVLSVRQDAAERQQAAERSRIEALDQRARQQALVLQEQALSVRQLGGEVQALRDERQVIELAAAFDAAVGSGRWEQARAFLAPSVTVDLVGGADAVFSPTPADSFLADLSRSLPAGRVQPRSNQQVRVEGTRAVLQSDGYAWGGASRSRQPFGRYEYRLERTADGWRIDGLTFRPSMPS